MFLQNPDGNMRLVTDASVTGYGCKNIRNPHGYWLVTALRINPPTFPCVRAPACVRVRFIRNRLPSVTSHCLCGFQGYR
jgi:hypothetical protein